MRSNSAFSSSNLLISASSASLYNLAYSSSLSLSCPSFLSFFAFSSLYLRIFSCFSFLSFSSLSRLIFSSFSFFNIYSFSRFIFSSFSFLSASSFSFLILSYFCFWVLAVSSFSFLLLYSSSSLICSSFSLSILSYSAFALLSLSSSSSLNCSSRLFYSSSSFTCSWLHSISCIPSRVSSALLILNSFWYANRLAARPSGGYSPVSSVVQCDPSSPGYGPLSLLSSTDSSLIRLPYPNRVLPPIDYIRIFWKRDVPLTSSPSLQPRISVSEANESRI